VVGLLLSASVFCANAWGVEIEYEMYSDPVIAVPEPIISISPQLIPLWRQALAAPESDVRRQAADAIALAHRSGWRDMTDMAEFLMRPLDDPDLHPVVVQAIARALVDIDATQSADILFKRASEDAAAVAQIVEPALARWNYEPIQEIWRKRIAVPNTRRRLLILAIEGLAAVDDDGARPELLKLVRTPSLSVDLRLAAARGLAKLQPESLVQEAGKLAAEKSPERIVDRLLAATIVSRHKDQDAISLMLDLAVDAEPTVAAVALEGLLEIDPDLVIAIVDKISENDDANVRYLAARAVASRTTAESVRLLTPMLDDPHPDVRGFVRESLEEMASEEELTSLVIEQGADTLASDRWRALEQAAILLVKLDHKPAASRLVELMDFERGEVFVAAAWGLGQLAVAETIEAMNEKLVRALDLANQTKGMDEHTTRQVGHLVQALGRLKHAPCEPILIRHVPKDSAFPPELRAAVVWALGHLHAGKPDPDVETKLYERMTDENPLMPEMPIVRTMAAVSLGRMRSISRLERLRSYAENEGLHTRLGYASAWAAHQIAGDPLPVVEPMEVHRWGWFLEPVETPESNGAE
jgi:HEAT repeat protein